MSYIDSRGVAVQPQTLGITPVTSLSAQSATTATPTVLDGLSLRTTAVMVVNTSAGVSAGSVQMMGSLDGVSYYNVGSAVSTTSASTVLTPVVVTNTPFRFLKAVIATAVTGGTITASVGASG
jgi:hypothetical protein